MAFHSLCKIYLYMLDGTYKMLGGYTFFCCTYDTFSYIKRISKKKKYYNGSWFHQQPPPYTKSLFQLNNKMDIATSWIMEIVMTEIRIATYYVIGPLDV